jgi:hypothetical protein
LTLLLGFGAFASAIVDVGSGTLTVLEMNQLHDSIEVDMG